MEIVVALVIEAVVMIAAIALQAIAGTMEMTVIAIVLEVERWDVRDVVVAKMLLCQLAAMYLESRLHLLNPRG
jgi:hypothetical protein